MLDDIRWYSTKDSVEKGEPTVLAVVETLLAVVVYWGIAWYYDTHIHLLVSICVAPLLLLRSKESTEEGARWFYIYWSIFIRRTEISPQITEIKFWGIVLCLAAISIVCEYTMSHYMQLDYTGWQSMGYAILGGAIVLILAISIGVAGAIEGADEFGATTALALLVPVVSAIIAILFYMVSALLSIVIFRFGLLGVLISLILIFTITKTAKSTRARAGAKRFVLLISEILLFVMIAFGVWLRSLGVRVVATLRHPWLGLLTVPNNWLRNLWSVDLRHPPELVPGLETQTNQLAMLTVLRRIRFQNQFAYVASPFIFLIFFGPALLYRWSLKSTCWLYLPLIYLFTGPGWRTSQDQGRLVTALCKDAWEKFRRGLALVSLLVMIGGTVYLQYPELLDKAGDLHQTAPLAPVLIYVWAIDPGKVISWQWFSLISAVLTWVIYFYSDHAMNQWDDRRKADPTAGPVPEHAHRLYWMNRLRGFSTIIFMVLAWGYAVLALAHIDPQHLYGWLSFLDVIYGPYLNRGPP